MLHRPLRAKTKGAHSTSKSTKPTKQRNRKLATKTTTPPQSTPKQPATQSATQSTPRSTQPVPALALHIAGQKSTHGMTKELPEPTFAGKNEIPTQISEILQKGSQPGLFAYAKERSVQTIINPEKLRAGFESHLVHDGQDPDHVYIAKAPGANVLVLPASSKIGRKYVDDIRSGKVVEQMYGELTRTTGLQPIYTTDHTYVHWFRIHERNQRDFMKRLGLIETKLNQRFGSTYYLHVSKALPKFRKRWTVLRGPFVHKKAQDTYEYNHNEYICKVSYAFAITDPEINDFIYNQLKTQVIASGAGISFGWDVKLTKPKLRKTLYTPLSSPALKKEGMNDDITQLKYQNYIGQQELLRMHCETNDMEFAKFAGDPKLFPFRDRILRAREKQLARTIAAEKGHSFDSDEYDDALSELSEYLPTDVSENASDIMRL